jgi:hypothetical protein
MLAWAAVAGFIFFLGVDSSWAEDFPSKIAEMMNAELKRSHNPGRWMPLATFSDCRVALLGALEGGHSCTSMMHVLRGRD